jgi:hypothetical protein
MTTYLIMQNRISDEVRNVSTASSSDIQSQIKLAILSAIAHYERERFYFSELRSETFATVANQEFYGTADNANIPNLAHIDSLTMTINSTQRWVLREREWNWFEQYAFDTSFTGDPEYYAYYGRQIRLGPIPNAVRTIRISGVWRLTALSADADTNVWTTEAEELIRSRAKWDLWRNVLKEEQQAQISKQTESEAYAALKRETTHRLTSRVSGMFI